MTAVGDTRRRQILDGAATCFARRGFHQATMKDICEAVALSPGSLYRYFRSKDDIVVALIEEERKQTAALLDALGREPDLIDGFRNLLRTVFDALNDSATHAIHAEVTAEALRNPAVRDRVRAGEEATVSQLAATLQAAQRKKAVAGELDARTTAEVIVAIVDGLWWRKALHPATDTAGYTDAVTSVIRRLLLPATRR